MLISILNKLLFKWVLISFALIALSTNASPVNENSIDSIFFYIYNQQFNKAEKELILSKNSLNPITYNLLKVDFIWWKTLSLNNENDFELLEKDLSEKLSNIDNLSNHQKLEQLIYLNYCYYSAVLNF